MSFVQCTLLCYVIYTNTGVNRVTSSADVASTPDGGCDGGGGGGSGGGCDGVGGGGGGGSGDSYGGSVVGCGGVGGSGDDGDGSGCGDGSDGDNDDGTDDGGGNGGKQNPIIDNNAASQHQNDRIRTPKLNQTMKHPILALSCMTKGL